MRENERRKVRDLLKRNCNVQIDAYTSGWRTFRICCPRGVSEEEYAVILQREPDELRKLVRRLLVSTTSFFRDRERWEELFDGVLSPPNKFSPLHVLSIGSACGQEPYTFLMMAMERTEPELGMMLAVDASNANLERARKGLYSAQELEEVPETFRQKWFTETPQGWQISDQLRGRVKFVQHDVLAVPPEPWKASFNLVIMRNVIIHMTPEYQEIALCNAVQMLVAGGVLFLGTSEILPRPKDYGVSHLGRCFYRKGGDPYEA